MLGATAAATEAVLDRVAQVLDDGADPTVLAEQLYSVVAVLDSQPSLRRVLTDPTVDLDRRADLVEGLLGEYDPATVGVVTTAVRHRWSGGRHQADALERGGNEALLAGAEAADELAEVEDEVFRFTRVLEAESALRTALSDQNASVEARTRLVDTLLEQRASPATARLVRQAVSGHQRSVVAALVEVQRQAAARQQRWVAVVRVAGPLDDALRSRLEQALAAAFEHELQLNVIIDPEVLGGVKVSVGDHVIDGTVATRLAAAHRRMAG